MARVSAITDTLEQRVLNADYRARRFPSLTELSAELHANPRTVRKALLDLVRRGILHKLPSGRIAVAPEIPRAVRHLVLLAPAYPTPWIAIWHLAIERLATARGWQLKLVGYTHWRDVMIPQTIRAFDGVFFVPMGDDLPAETVSLLQDSGRRVVVLEQDTSGYGLPCLRFTTPSSIRRLLDEVANHEAVSCLNTQPLCGNIQDRIDQWRLWTRAHGKGGQLINEPVELFGSSLERAYATIRRRLEQRALGGTALFCVTGAAALGAMRAIRDHGLCPGRDIAVCSADDDAGRLPYTAPSVTCLSSPAWDPYLQVCLDWFAGDHSEWQGPLLVQPDDVPVFQGESTRA